MSRRYFDSLRPIDCSTIDAIPGRLFLTRIEHAQYRWHVQKPYYAVVFSVLEPKLLVGYRLYGHLYCTPKAIWKLNWLLRDFGYDTELLSRGEVNDGATSRTRRCGQGELRDCKRHVLFEFRSLRAG